MLLEAGHAAPHDPRAPVEPEIRALAPTERGRVLAWLDDGLRDGRKGRLCAEYPTLLEPGIGALHRLAWVGGRPAAHAAGRVVRVRVDACELDLGMVGLVYTDPAFRRRGLGSVVVEACARALAERGAQLAVLWSDRHAFYARLGFVPAGRERMLVVGRDDCAAAARRFGPGASVAPPREGDWPALERMHARKRARAERAPGELRRLAAAPDCTVRVARSGDTPVAYAARGRGDDFGGVVHEWAGSPAGVTACVASFLAESDPVRMLSGPGDAQPVAALHAAGAAAYPGAFGLVRLLDADGVWSRLTAGLPALSRTRLRPAGDGFRLESGRAGIELGPADALALLIGPALPPAVRAGLEPGVAGAVARALPAPLFVWGFDSI